MNDSIRVRLLAETPEVIPTLARWYKSEWADWFINTALGDIEADFRSVANTDRLPLALVAFDQAGSPTGVCSVRDEPFEPYPHAGPWLRGLYVHPPFRGQGVAAGLIRAACAQAGKLHVAKLYAATHSAVSTFELAGWLGFDQVLHDGQMLTIFAKRIN